MHTPGGDGRGTSTRAVMPFDQLRELRENQPRMHFSHLPRPISNCLKLGRLSIDSRQWQFGLLLKSYS